MTIRFCTIFHVLQSEISFGATHRNEKKQSITQGGAFISSQIQSKATYKEISCDEGPTVEHPFAQ